MPIDLTNIVSVASANARQNKYSPSFFSKEIKGRFNGDGIFTYNLNPLNAMLSTTELQDTTMYSLSCEPRVQNRTRKNNNFTKLNYITFSPYYRYSTGYFEMIDQTKTKKDPLLHDNLGAWIKINKAKTINKTLYFRLVPFRMRLRKSSTTVNGKLVRTNSVIVSYLAQIYYPNKNSQYIDVLYFSDKSYQGAVPNALTTNLNSNGDGAMLINVITLRPKDVFLNDAGYDFKSWFTNKKTSNRKKLDQYIAHYILYDHLSDLSKIYQTKFTNLIKFLTLDGEHDIYDSIKDLIEQAEYLRLPLDQQQKIYTLLSKYYKQKKLNDNEFKSLINSNLNLKFNNVLYSLKGLKKHLAHFNKNKKIKVSKNLSLEQKQAVTTTSPLALVEAGAGTGKSSVILNRIKYLIDNGITPETIQVLSFTNAAADHIKNLYPRINSTTIASLVAQMYRDNWPNQNIVSNKIFKNMLNIKYSRNSPDMGTFIDGMDMLCSRPQKGDINYLDRGYRVLSELIHRNPKLVLGVCQAIHQTTLDLQILICYEFLNKMSFTNQTTTKYLMIDESQDSSIFEFMFLLKYIILNKASFFMVGDASQTLYEFRNANPKALNVLENSGLFDLFRLDVNFRSRQEILDYANTLLREMKSNQIAKIQLHANSLRKETQADYDKNVRIVHFKAENPSKELYRNIATDGNVNAFIKQCLLRNENVAILAWSRRAVFGLQDAFSKVYNKKFKNIVAKRIDDSDLFSSFWADLSNHSRLALLNCQDIKQLLDMILRIMKDQLQQSKPVQDFCNNQWDNFVKHNTVVLTSMQNRHIKISNLILNKIRHLMLKYEIDTNRKRQQVSKNINSIDNRKNIIAHNKIIFSTIHSVKGLEFDNVILFMTTQQIEQNETKKRLYYVGLTRAKNSELALDINMHNLKDSLMYMNYKATRDSI